MTAKEILESLLNSELLALDLETSSLDFYTGKIGCITLCNDGEIGYFIPWKIIEEKRLKRLLSSVLLTAKKTVLANGKFDFKFLWHNGVAKDVRLTDDIGLLAHAIHSDRPRGLKAQAIIYSYFGGYENELEKFLKQTKVESFLDIPPAILSKYATLDAIVTWRVYQAQLKNIRYIDRTYPNEKMPEWSMEKHYTQIMMPIARLFAEIEYNGFYINKKLMDENREKLYKVVHEQEDLLAAKLGKRIEFGSTKQLGELLKENKWPCIEVSKDGTYSTSDTCLKAWEKLGYKEVTDAITKMRSASVFIKTFLGGGENNPTGWQTHMRDTGQGTHVIHQSYFIMGTTTFRFVGVDPNMQQVPSSGKMAQLVKQVVLPPHEIWYKIKDDNGNILYDVPFNTKFLTSRGEILVQNLDSSDIIKQLIM